MKLGAFFNDKLKKGYEGRKLSLQKVKEKIGTHDKTIWMHAASLGEYEQGLPVLQALKKEYPNHKIVVTFFSPSGYEIINKKTHDADVICYLPFDKKKEISAFVNTVNPEIFFTVKYDFWYNLLSELKQKECRIYVVSALFYPQQVYFKSYGKWFVEQLKRNVDVFFHQNASSLSLANSIGLGNGLVSGDTRFDRVRQILGRNNHVDFIQDFKAGSSLVVFGSSWEDEEKIALKLMDSNCKIILAPHEMKRIAEIQSQFPHSLLYSELLGGKVSKQELLEAKCLIIDSIGLLSKIYSYADVAVVGGGFHSKGLHNILDKRP